MHENVPNVAMSIIFRFTSKMFLAIFFRLFCLSISLSSFTPHLTPPREGGDLHHPPPMGHGDASAPGKVHKTF